MAVRRQSQGFARGSSKFRGVTKHPNGRWEARIGTPGSKHVYLGLFHEESEAARAYDRALVKMRGPGSATNFSISTYKAELKEFHVQPLQPAELQASLASGKGEACKHVLNKYGVEHVTPASILRFFAKEETERGTEAKACMDRTLSGEAA